ncbi:MAG: outer membrane beta-barrel protein [Candidatus Longimicrobiales bacterium M2_2A_002]
MIKRTLLAAAVLTALVHLGATPAMAQGINSPYDFVDRPHSFYFFGSAVFTDRGTLDTGPGSGYALGLEYSYRVSGPFNIAARVSYLPTDRRVYNDTSTVADSLALQEDLTFGLDQVGTADVSMLLLDASLRFDLTGPRTWHGFQPYALVGVGGVLVTSQGTDGEDQLPPDAATRVRMRDGFTGHVGAGVEFYASEHLTVRADARDLLWKIHIPVGFRQPGRVIDREQWVQTAHLSLGLVLRF